MTDAEADDLCVLVLAPRGRDSAVVCQVLETHGLKSLACATMGELVADLRQGAGLVFVTEEALAEDGLPGLATWLAHQPPWADLPVVVLTTRQAGKRSAQALATLEALGNVVLLERPLNAETLVSAARSALRSRARQYQTRRHLEEQARIGRENERLYQAEGLALRDAAQMRERLLDTERIAREEAEHASRTKDEFLATLSHELRTPLNVILGWVHLLRKRNFSGPELVRGIDTIERNARAQSRLIDELLDMSRIIAGNVHLELQPLMPATVLEAVLASLQPAIDARGVRIERDIDAATGPVAADAHRLQQVLWNLLSNAIKFTPAGGTIGVCLLMEAGRVKLEISDSGEGIARDFLPFVFDRFRQADGSSTRKHGGLGLGLAIVRQLVELHGGVVQANSEGAGQGARFTVSLPRARELVPESLVVQEITPAAGAASPQPGWPNGRELPDPQDHPAALQGVRLLLVDDDADGREMVARTLSDRGAEVVAAASAEEAIAALQRGPAFKLLISDIGMPVTDGYQLLLRVRQLGHRLPAIALTAFARHEDRVKALNAGYAMHMAKPVEPQELVASVARLISRVPAAAELNTTLDNRSAA